jgi:hypothetical protein
VPLDPLEFGATINPKILDCVPGKTSHLMIGKVGRNIEKLSTGGRDRLREHGVAALDAHLLVPAGANEMRQPIGVAGLNGQGRAAGRPWAAPAWRF